MVRVLPSFRWVWLLALAIGLPGATWAAPKRIAVLEVRSGPQAPVNEAEARVLTDAVRGEALTLPATDYLVMTRENILELLPPGTDLAACEGNCEVETGRNLGADIVAVAKVDRFGKQLVLTLQIYRTAGGALIRQTTATAAGVDTLLPQTRLAAHTAFLSLGGPGTPAVAGEGTTGGEAAKPGRKLNAAIVEFSSEPDGAIVHLDGELLCQATPCSRLVTFGPHQVSMEAEMHQRHDEPTTVTKAASIHWKLKANFAVLRVSAPLADVAVTLDGEPAGNTPLAELHVAPGAHRVEVDPKCWLAAGEQVKVAAGDVREVALAAKPRTQSVEVRPRDAAGNDVAAAVFWAGGQPVEVPAFVDVPVCATEVFAQRPEHGTVRATFADLGTVWTPIFDAETTEANVFGVVGEAPPQPDANPPPPALPPQMPNLLWVDVSGGPAFTVLTLGDGGQSETSGRGWAVRGGLGVMMAPPVSDPSNYGVGVALDFTAVTDTTVDFGTSFKAKEVDPNWIKTLSQAGTLTAASNAFDLSILCNLGMSSMDLLLYFGGGLGWGTLRAPGVPERTFLSPYAPFGLDMLWGGASTWKYGLRLHGQFAITNVGTSTMLTLMTMSPMFVVQSH